jgi:hypothetical protein
MSLKNINNKTVLKLMESTIKNYELFDTYEVKRSDEKTVKSPIIRTNYDLVLESKLYDRWLFIRIEDFYKYQKLVIWFNKLWYPEPVNFSLERYFAGNENLNKSEIKWVIKIKTKENLVDKIRAIIDVIEQQNLEKVKDIIKGQSWIDLPFDWEGYK